MRWRQSDRTGDMMGNSLPPCRSACGPQLPGQARAQAPAARWLIAHVCCAPPAMGGISARHARPADFAHAHPQDTAPSNVDFDSEFVVTTAALAPGPGTVRAWSVCAPCVCSCSPAWCGRTGSTVNGQRKSGVHSGTFGLTPAWRMAAVGLSYHHACWAGGPSWYTGAVGRGRPCG